ncbi:hypothetical protein HOA92_00010 [archaeon]|jgi:hypothetical protein|nr:hypothetical protein [archaeon]MBT6761403.1 hypothetical protein [archaeon]
MTYRRIREVKEIKYQVGVDTGEAISGREIMKTMSEMAVDSDGHLKFRQQRLPDGRMKIGYSSISPQKHVALITGDNLDQIEFDPNASYENLALARHVWPKSGPQQASGINEEIVQYHVDPIAQELEDRLK